MTNTDFKVIVCAAIFNRDGKVLLARRKPGKMLGGFWEFPGGKLEHGEELIPALKREISEELAIDINVTELLLAKPHVYDHGAVLILFYKADLISKTAPQLVDHDEVEWCDPTEIKNHKLLPANQEVLNRLTANH